MASYLVDTHVYLWADHAVHKLCPKVREILANPKHTIYLSMASLWEMQIKIQLGKLTLDTPLQEAMNRVCKQGLYQILPIKLSHLWTLERLPHLHNDPFDRLLMAQSLNEKLPFITADSKILQYGMIECVAN
ncbi:hypothetical protein B0181_02240 [Moraxella caviae]|uniref:PIN domain-containing protein n=1 Tax=Moraxella caviae TaxID=34060 RepID=A0A1T0A836_9GAMM|nr:type II toxin-antitoxin system VapC family toxin [Moraxella caviae]OOR91874.1 hypothetical protein B0181_02240 [Moraxella caviae]STZ09723.1 Uncharacterised protein [Moraxella caviae]